MKRFVKVLAVTMGIVSLVSIAMPVSAANLNSTLCQRAAAKGEGTPTICKDNAAGDSTNPIVGPGGIMTRLVSVFSIAIGIAAVIVSIVSGLRFVLANGDSGAVASARKGLLYALVGLGVAGFAQTIVSFVLAKL